MLPEAPSAQGHRSAIASREDSLLARDIGWQKDKTDGGEADTKWIT